MMAVPDVFIQDVLRENEQRRREEQAVRDLLIMAETEPDELADFKEICEFLNKTKITIGTERTALYAVLDAGPIDAMCFDPEEPIPTPAEVFEKNIRAVFKTRREAESFAHDNGFQVLKIEEMTPEMEKRDEECII